MDFISLENHENTLLAEADFQFNCFHIFDSETLPHWHKHMEIIYIRQGTCHVYLNGIPVLCQEGDIILVPQGNLHSILPQAQVEYLAIVIGDTLFTGMIQDLHCEMILKPFLSGKALSTLHLSRNHVSHSVLASFLCSIMLEYFDKKTGYQLLIKVNICQFFTHLIRDYSILLNAPIHSNVQGNNTQLIKKALRYLSEHYAEKITIAYMSSQSNMSDQHFCRLFKSYTGNTFIDYLTNLRFDHANKLLTNTDLPITQIPELTGFCNANYFSRIYKRKFGYTPSQVRKSTTTLPCSSFTSL